MQFKGLQTGLVEKKVPQFGFWRYACLLILNVLSIRAFITPLGIICVQEKRLFMDGAIFITDIKLKTLRCISEKIGLAKKHEIEITRSISTLYAAQIKEKAGVKKLSCINFCTPDCALNFTRRRRLFTLRCSTIVLYKT